MSTSAMVTSQGEVPSLCGKIRDFSENTTLHGVKYMNSTSFAKRILWGAVLISSLCLCFHQIYKSVSYYLTWPVSTSITEEKVPDLPFPAVTLCNLCLIDVTRLLSYLSQGRLLTAEEKEGMENDVEQLISIFTAARSELTVKTIANSTGLPERFMYERDSELMSEFWKLHSPKISDMLSFQWPYSCQWNGEPCEAQNFTSLVTERLGQCYTFNSGKEGHPLLNTTLSGASSGLKLRLNIQRDFYTRNFLQPTAGFKIIIHDQTEFPFIEELGFAVQPGTHIYCAVRRKKIENLESPYKSKCGTKTLNFTQYYNISYSRPACVRDCQVKETIRRCGCQSGQRIFDNIPICSSIEVATCVYPSYGKRSGKLEACLEDCPESCDYVKHDIQLSYGAVASYAFVRKGFDGMPAGFMPTETVQMFNNMSQAERRDFIRDNLITMDIYYEGMSYQLIKQHKAFDELDLVGNIGGYVGLFLGMSLLTLCEFLDLLAYVLVHFATRHKNKRNAVNVERSFTRTETRS